jgi:hypothetical protein
VVESEKELAERTRLLEEINAKIDLLEEELGVQRMSMLVV